MPKKNEKVDEDEDRCGEVLGFEEDWNKGALY